MNYFYSRIFSQSMGLFKFGQKIWLKSRVFKILVPETDFQRELRDLQTFHKLNLLKPLSVHEFTQQL